MIFSDNYPVDDLDVIRNEAEMIVMPEIVPLQAKLTAGKPKVKKVENISFPGIKRKPRQAIQGKLFFEQKYEHS